MKGLFSILQTAPVFSIHPRAGQNLVDSAIAVLNREVQFSPELFGVQANEPRTDLTGSGESQKQNTVRIFPLHGVMLAQSQVCGLTGSVDQAREILAAAFDDSVGAIMLDIMSPGGQVLGTEELANAVATAREQKPVIAYVNGMACSAAYEVAVEAHHIMLNGINCEVGSIGTLIHYLDFSEAMEKAGVREVKVVSSKSPNKAKFNYSQPTDEDREKMQVEMLDPLTELFQRKVAARRADIDTARAFTGDVYFAEAAIEIGLADSIGNYITALNWCRDQIQETEMGIFSKETPKPVQAETAAKLQEAVTAIQATTQTLAEEVQDKINAMESAVGDVLKAMQDRIEMLEQSEDVAQLKDRITALEKQPAREGNDVQGVQVPPAEDAANQADAETKPSWAGFASHRLNDLQ